MPVNYIDFIILIPLLIGIWRGFTKGLVLELFGVLAIFTAIYASIKFSDTLSAYIRENQWSDSPYLGIISFASIFLASLIGVYLIGKIIDKAVDITALSIPNKIAGAFLGAAKSLLFLALFAVLISNLNSRNEFIPKKTLSSSLLFEPLCQVGLWILPIASDSELLRQAADFLKELKQPSD